MNDLTEIRQELVTALNRVDGLRAFESWPRKLSLPAAVVVPDDPYIVAGNTFGTNKINLRVLLIARAVANNAVISEELDSIIDETLTQLHPDWNVGEVEAPTLINIDGNDYIGTSFAVNEIYERTST